MSKDYADSRFGVRKAARFTKTASLAGTVSSNTELDRFRLFEAVNVSGLNVTFQTGGTIAATMALVLGYSLAGTGAFTAIGTATLATNADNTCINGTCTTTALAAGDELVLCKLGTSAAVNVAVAHVSYTEAFVNA